MIVEPATREDIEAFSDIPNKPTMKAWAGKIDDQIVLLGGLAFKQGRWFAFCDLKDEAREHKFALARAAIRVFEDARAMGIRYVYAEADPDEPTSHRWLTSLGFTLDPRSEYLYRWSG
jgi:hypothetical protein